MPGLFSGSKRGWCKPQGCSQTPIPFPAQPASLFSPVCPDFKGMSWDREERGRKYEGLVPFLSLFSYHCFMQLVLLHTHPKGYFGVRIACLRGQGVFQEGMSVQLPSCVFTSFCFQGDICTGTDTWKKWGERGTAWLLWILGHVMRPLVHS